MSFHLIVINDFGTATGGATSLAIASAIGVRNRGYRVTYITSEGDIDPALCSYGVEVITVKGSPISPQNRLSGSLLGIWRQETLKKISGIIRKYDNNKVVYHLHNWSHFLSPSVFLAISGVRSRVLMTTHDFFLFCPNGAQYNFNAERVCTLVGGSLNCFLTDCDRRNRFDKIWRLARHSARELTVNLKSSQGGFIAIHPGMVPAMERYGIQRERIYQIRNPVRPFFSAGRVPVEHNKEVLFVGRISYEKGPDLLAEAARRAGVIVRFIGDGPMRSLLQKRYPEMIFDGFLNRGEIANRAMAARLAVMPGRWAEPFGMVGPEALWSGIPILVSNNALISNEVAESQGGVALDPRDLTNFADLLSRLSGDDSAVRTMSINAFRNTRKIGTTIEEWIDQHISLYSSLL